LRLTAAGFSATEDRAALRHDEARLSGTKHRFVTAVEAVLDIAHHLLASETWDRRRTPQGRSGCWAATA
jgi:uncharacterized protein YutE (UPF0331/DUF86 family)